MVSSATTAATIATTGTGARRTSTSTIGIRTTAVAMRLSKGIFVRIQDLTTEGTEVHRGSQVLCETLCPLWLGFCGERRMLRVCVAVIQPAVAALTLLIFGDAFEQMHTAKIRP